MKVLHFINPWRACARVTVLVLCVCLFVCVSVIKHLTSGSIFQAIIAATYSYYDERQKICGNLAENASLPRYSNFHAQLCCDRQPY